MREHARLQVAKAIDPVLLDDVLAALARSPLDLAIDLDHPCTEVMREDRRDRRLTDPRRAHEEEMHVAFSGAARADEAVVDTARPPSRDRRRCRCRISRRARPP